MTSTPERGVSIRIHGVDHPLDGVLFDLDGTLYHQRPLRAKMARELLWLPFRLRSLRRAKQVVAEIRAYRHALEALRSEPPESPDADLATQQCEIAALKAQVTPEQVAQTAHEWLQQRPLRHLRTLRRSGIETVLDALRTAGARLGVFSDYPVDAKLDALELGASFAVKACASDQGIMALKPDPKGMLVACSRLGTDPARTLYVGDRIEVDGEAAIRAGMPCAIIGRQAARAGAPLLGTATFAELHRALSVRP